MTKLIIVLIVLAVIFIVIPAIFKMLFWAAIVLGFIGFIHVMISEVEPRWWSSIKSAWDKATNV